MSLRLILAAPRHASSRFLCSIVMGLLLASIDTARSTILVFDQERDGQSIVVPTSSGGTPPSDYGDHVTSAAMPVPGGIFTYGNAGEGFTPHVGVDIFAAGATPTDSHVRLWQTGYGDLANVIFTEGPGIAGAPMLSVRLTAEVGYRVELYGFDLAGFGADYTIAGVTVLAGTDTLFSELDVLVEGDMTGPRHTTFAFDDPLSAPELLLQIDLSNLPSNLQDNVGLDNLRFGQHPPIPEPASLLLGAIAALFFVSLRGRAVGDAKFASGR